MGQRGHVIHGTVRARAAVVCGEQQRTAVVGKQKKKKVGEQSCQLAAATPGQLAAAKSDKSKKRSFRQLAAANTTKSRRQSSELAATKSAKSIDRVLLFGDVTETDEQHLARHACATSSDNDNFQNCFRCMTIRKRKEIAQLAPWAAERPRHLGGAWGWGCRICAAGRLERTVQSRRRAHMRANKDTGVCKQAVSRCSKWGKFQYFGTMRRGMRPWSDFKRELRDHAASDYHRLSADVFKNPSHVLAPVATEHSLTFTRQAMDAQLVVDAVENCFGAHSPRQPAAPLGQPAAPGQLAADELDLGIGSIQDPFRGNLPQREDWVDVWAEMTSTTAFRKQESVNEKRCLAQLERRNKRKMVDIEAEVVRESTRKRIREATAVSVAVDECDTRKIIRVRCDTPEPPHQWDGVLGIIRKRYGLRATTEHILYLQQGVCRSARVSRFCNKCKKSELRQSSNLIDPGFGVLSVRSVGTRR